MGWNEGIEITVVVEGRFVGNPDSVKLSRRAIFPVVHWMTGDSTPVMKLDLDDTVDSVIDELVNGGMEE